MIDVASLQPGVVLDYWHDDGVGGQLCYARVVRLTPHFVVLEKERGEQIRMSRTRLPGFFNKVVPSHWWSPWNPEGT
jgi:hypothetical protein